MSVGDLPNEILTEIFLACVEAVDADPDGRSTLDPNSPPWVLASVCCLWRNICLATPALWSRLPTISLDRQYLSPWHLTRALALSSPERLDLSLMLWSEGCSNIPLLDTIIPHFDRCRSLALTINDGVLATLADHRCDFQCLEELRMIAQPLHWPSPLFDVSRSAPLLSRFSASFPYGSASIDMYLRIDWSKLTHLSLEYISFHQVYRILQNTALLQAFHLKNTPDEDSSHTLLPGGPVIRLNHLTTWSLQCSAPIDMLDGGQWDFKPAQLLDSFTLPSLSTLCSNYTGECDTYISLVRRSRCSITHLRTALMRCSPEEMLGLLGALPTVRVLEVVMDNLPSMLHSMKLFLSTPMQSPFILPSLQHLKLLTRTMQGIPVDLKAMLEQFIHSRTEGLLSHDFDDRDSVKFQLLERVSLYLPTKLFTSRVFLHLTGQPGSPGSMNGVPYYYIPITWGIVATRLPSLIPDLEEYKARLEGFLDAIEGGHKYDPIMCDNLPTVGLNISRVLAWIPPRFPEYPELQPLVRSLQELEGRWMSTIDQLSRNWVCDVDDDALTYSTGYSSGE